MPVDTSRCFALLPCAGSGARAGGVVPKQYQPVAGVPMVRHTLAAFLAVARIARVLVVVAPGDDTLQAPDAAYSIAACGGATRAQSVFNGLAALRDQGAGADDWVLVHDAARPCLRGEYLTQLAEVLGHDEVGGLLALPVADTVKRADIRGRVAATVPREGLWLAQTPQMFRFAVLRTALERHPEVTDEASAVEAAGLAPKLVEGDPLNLKVTRPGDLALAAAILRLQEEA